MIKRLLILGIIIFITVAIGKAQHKNKDIGYSAYLSMGGCSPVNFENNTNDFSFVDLASETASGLGFEIGGAVYYKKIGLNLGFGYYKYVMDANKYQAERQAFFPNENITTFISEKVRDIPVFLGLSYYIKIDNFYIEPGIFVRLNKIIAPNYADTYFWDNNNLTASINYLKNNNLRLDYVPSLSLSYFYPISKWHRVGIQLSYQYSFSNPTFEYTKTEFNLQDNTIIREKQKLSAAYSSSKICFGIIVRYN